MIDPSHGGYDKGATFGGKLVEKDITLRLAREVRKELEERGIAARLLRESDIDLSLDRRAEITNEQRAEPLRDAPCRPSGKRCKGLCSRINRRTAAVGGTLSAMGERAIGRTESKPKRGPRGF